MPGTPKDEAAALRADNAALRAAVAASEAQIAALRAGRERDQARLAALAGEVDSLRAEVAGLRARLAADSTNSSRPPSSDGLDRPVRRSLRRSGGRRPGRPAGQPGTTLALTDAPDQVLMHEPGRCRGCGDGLTGAPTAGVERRQVIELPEIRARVTEHQIISRRCRCGVISAGKPPPGVHAPAQYGPRVSAAAVYLWHGQFLSRSRTCQAMAELFGVPVSPGAVAGMTTRLAQAVSPAVDAIRATVAAAPVAHFDETGFRVAGKLAWMHSASAGNHVLLTVHDKRGRQAMDAAGVLPAFAGIAVHDAWAPYDSYPNLAGHALCGAHLLRELTAVTETGTATDVIWAQQAIDALTALKAAADAARATGRTTIDPATLTRHRDYLHHAAAAGITLNASRTTSLHRKRHALARRIHDRADDYLRFATDLNVPFDNNTAERDIRMGKLRIKVSGCMRSMTGAAQFCAIRSYLATAAKHGIGALHALTQAASSQAWIPNTP